MKIVDLIQRELIVPTLHAKAKRELLDELAGHIAERSTRVDRATLSRVLAERELLASTAIGEGVAIPHGKLSSVTEITACLARAPSGVDFDSMDGQPTYLFFVLVAPESSTGAHLKALARISRVFKDAEFRQRLLTAPDAAAMFTVVAEEDAKY